LKGIRGSVDVGAITIANKSFHIIKKDSLGLHLCSSGKHSGLGVDKQTVVRFPAKIQSLEQDNRWPQSGLLKTVLGIPYKASFIIYNRRRDDE
jgi:hypothetical protein